MSAVHHHPDAGACEPFTLMVKPAGSACNMRCAYCYYLRAPGSGADGGMTADTLRMLIRRCIDASPDPTVTITWHGGEPMLAGLEFYREAVRIEKELLPEGWECWNNLQTNGLLLDDAWCAFLAEERFDVGVSIDGPAVIHDLCRKDAAGKGTYDRVVRGIRMLQHHGIQPDLLCTVTSETAKNGAWVYQTLRDLETGWMQFIPIVVRDGPDGVTKESVSPQAYGQFLKEVFSQWLYHDLDKTEVQLFSETALVLAGRKAHLCWLQETCGRALVVERDGTVFSCDHFVRPDYRIGSVWEDDLKDLVDGSRQRAFGNRKASGLTAYCRACPHLPICRGGCLKDRFGTAPTGEPEQYYLCEGLRSFFDYAVPRLRETMRLSARGMSRPDIMNTLTARERANYQSVSRNDPCPCVSGRKFKQCCQPLIP